MSDTAADASSPPPWRRATLLQHADAGLQGGATDVAPAISVSTTFDDLRDFSSGKVEAAPAEGSAGAPYIYSRDTQPSRSRCEALLSALYTPAVVSDADAGAGCGTGAVRTLLFSRGQAVAHALLLTLRSTAVLVCGGEGRSLAGAETPTSRRFHQLSAVAAQLPPSAAQVAVLAAGRAEEIAALAPQLRTHQRLLVWLASPCPISGNSAEAFVAALDKHCPQQPGMHVDVVADVSCAPGSTADFHAALLQRRRVTALVLWDTATLVGTLPPAAPVTAKPTSAGSAASLQPAALVTRQGELADRLHTLRTCAGLVPGSFEPWLLMRALRSLELRARRAQASTAAIVTAINTEERRVTAHAAADGAALLFVDFATQASAEAFLQRLKCFRRSAATGSVQSHALLLTAVDIHAPDGVVRLAPGIEDTPDLLADVRQALGAGAASGGGEAGGTTALVHAWAASAPVAPASYSERLERCQQVLCQLLGGPTVLYPAGLCAAHAALQLFAPQRVVMRAGYHGCHLLVETLHAAGTIAEVEKVPDLAAAKALGLRPSDVVWLESPINPHCVLEDIAAWAALAHTVGARVLVDATFGPPPLQQLLGCGADAVMHSTTKFVGGHSDTLGGTLTVPAADASSHARLLMQQCLLGLQPGALELELLAHSLPTVLLRVQQATATATTLAGRLQAAMDAGALPALTRVWHPSLPSHPQHALAQAQMLGGFGPMLAIELDTPARAGGLARRLRLFRDATSLGGVESLAEWRLKCDKRAAKTLVRLSVGLEDEDDLWHDLRAVLAEN